MGNYSWVGLALVTVVMLVAWLYYRRLAAQTGLPAGEVIYQDTAVAESGWYANDETFTSPELGLVGRPDYLVAAGDGTIIPVEVKSGRAPADPYDSHVLQLAAYCALVADNFGVRPPYGIIQYQDRAYAVDYDYELEEDLLDVIAEMRSDMYAADVDRDHEDWQRCARCGVSGACVQRLA